MSTEGVEARLQAIEARLAGLEKNVFGAALGGGPQQHPPEAVSSPVSTPLPPARPSLAAQLAAARKKDPHATASNVTSSNVTASNVLGWGGAVALVLAAAYLIRLAM